MMERKYSTGAEKKEKAKEAAEDAGKKRYPWEKADAGPKEADRVKVGMPQKKLTSNDYRDEYLRQKAAAEGSTGGLVASEKRVKGNKYADEYQHKKMEQEEMGMKKRAQDEADYKIRMELQKQTEKAYEEKKRLAQKAFEEKQQETQKAFEEQQRQNQKFLESQQH